MKILNLILRISIVLLSAIAISLVMVCGILNFVSAKIFKAVDFLIGAIK